ncbi:MAG: hypothetical protein JKY34_10560 [Kordiimonadaceae bacterium]|nr:hypothetical protein [Kordiimonadaceae bacterium]
MSENTVSRFKLFPVIIFVACAALGLRTLDIYTGLNLFDEAVLAEQEAMAEDEQAAGIASDQAAAGGEEAAIEKRKRPSFVIGLPDSDEMKILTQLRKRRESLVQREQQIELQAQLLSSTEKRIDDKILKLQVLETQIKGHLRLFEEREDGQLKSIVKVYETMKPKDAAPRFEVLALQTQLDLVQRMKPSKIAALMAKMTPNKASALTTELATRAQPPRISELSGS